MLFTEIISRYGAPRAILSDRGQTFMSKLVKALSELFEIKRSFTSPYHPMTNGMTECKNSYILQALRAYCKGQQDDWPEILPGIMMAYQSTPATQSTQYSPFFMLYGREMRLPIDTVLQPKNHLPQDYKVHLSRILQNLEVCRKLAGENIKAAQDKYKYHYDKRAKVPDYRPAQRVWLYCTKVPMGKAPKLHRKWVGPYYITVVGPNHTYRLWNVRTNAEVRSLVNAMRLKPYYDPEDRPTNPPDPLLDNEDEFDPEELEQIIRNRNNTNGGNQNQNAENIEGRQRPETHEKKQKSVRTNEGNTKPVQSKSKADTNKGNTKPVQSKSKVDSSTETKKINNQSGNASKANRSSKNKVSDTAQNRSVYKGKQTNKSQANKQAGNRNQGENTKDAGQSKSNKYSESKNQNAPKSENSKEMTKQTSREQKQLKHSNNPDSGANTEQKGVKSNQQNPQTQSVGNKNSKYLQPTNQGKEKRKTIPSCKDCKSGNCKMFHTQDIKAILASQRSNGALYYKVKWQNGTTDWYFPCKIPNQLIREYHANRTMSGKKRKKTLQNKQHKFFKEAEPSANVLNTQTKTDKEKPQVDPNATKLVGVKLIKDRSYYLVQKGNLVPEYQPVTMAHWHARGFIIHLIDLYQKIVEEDKINIYKIQNYW